MATCSAAVAEFSASACGAPHGVGELLLELLDAGARRQPAGPQDRDDLVDFGLADIRLEERHFPPRRRRPVRRPSHRLSFSHWQFLH